MRLEDPDCQVQGLGSRVNKESVDEIIVSGLGVYSLQAC